jgi:hypothetical protein
MHSRDLAGAAMFVGALGGFVIGGLIGFGDQGLSSPIVLPFVGALCGVVAAGLPFLLIGARRHRAEERLREARHEEFRLAAHDGWIDGVDLHDLRRRG